jgi:fructose-1,6-bisphosphatase I
MGAGMIGRSQVGDGVFGFTLDTVIGEFVMSHERIQIPDPGQRIYSGNQGNIDLWAPELKKYVEEVLQAGPNPYTYRYIGTYAVALSLELLAT